jgi:hypothetical protein
MFHESPPVVTRRSPRNPNTSKSGGNCHSHQTACSNTVSYVLGSFSGSSVARKVPGDSLVPTRTHEKPRKCDASSGCAATSSCVCINAYHFGKLYISSEKPLLGSRNSTKASDDLSVSSRTQDKPRKHDASSGHAATLLCDDDARSSNKYTLGSEPLASHSSKHKKVSGLTEPDQSYSKIKKDYFHIYKQSTPE